MPVFRDVHGRLYRIPADQLETFAIESDGGERFVGAEVPASSPWPVAGNGPEAPSRQAALGGMGYEWPSGEQGIGYEWPSGEQAALGGMGYEWPSGEQGIGYEWPSGEQAALGGMGYEWPSGEQGIGYEWPSGERLADSKPRAA